MSTASSSSSNGSAASSFRNRPIDPVTRTALRYTISPREYELLHQFVISRTPKNVQKRAPNPARYERMTGDNNKAGGEKDDSNVAAVRASLRILAVVFLGMKSWETIMRKIAQRRGQRSVPPSSQVVKYGNARVALSFSGIFLFHRLLSRFFRRLRTVLLEENAQPFRQRNPGVTKILTSRYTPAVGAALSGVLLGVSPSNQMRVTIAIYVFSRSLEFAYNALEESGTLWKSKENGGSGRPWWFGSWMLMPLACGQLLDAFVFDRDCFPEGMGNFILKRSPEYIQIRPTGYQGKQPWPGTFDIVDALAELSRLRWPPFISPILFPANQEPLPSSISKISPVTAPANPAIKHTSCALLHPHDPSCGRTYARFFSRSFPNVLRFFSLLYGAFALLAIKSLRKSPAAFVNRLSARILQMSLFITGAIGTSWASICFFNNYLPRHVLSTQRWFMGGFAGGMWAFIAKSKERSTFLYSARLSLDSLYKVGKKRGWWRGVKNGDVLLFVASIALLDYVYEARPDAIRGAMIRKSISVARGEGWNDRVAPTTDMKEKVERKEEQEEVLGEEVKKEL